MQKLLPVLFPLIIHKPLSGRLTLKKEIIDKEAFLIARRLH